MKIIYASDLHGHVNLYQELANLVSEVAPDVLLFGGDFFLPTVQVRDQFAFIDDYLLDYFAKLETRIMTIYGNADLPPAMDYLIRHSKVEYLDLTPVALSDGLSVIGYSMVNPSPFRLKNHERREWKTDSYIHPKSILITVEQDRIVEEPPDLLNRLPSMEEELGGIGRDTAAIWVMHAPPYGGYLDMIHNQTHVGSQVIAHAIRECQPLVTLHGHIHESPSVSGQWYERIGRTVCINPGHSPRRLHAVLLEIDEKEQTLASFRHTQLSRAEG